MYWKSPNVCSEQLKLLLEASLSFSFLFFLGYSVTRTFIQIIYLVYINSLIICYRCAYWPLFMLHNYVIKHRNRDRMLRLKEFTNYAESKLQQLCLYNTSRGISWVNGNYFILYHITIYTYVWGGMVFWNGPCNSSIVHHTSQIISCQHRSLIQAN